jgi:hypothetical protein
MERFYDNEEENDDDNESFFGANEPYEENPEDEEVVGYIDQQGIIDVMHMDLAQSKLNQHILGKAIEICQGNWLWYFKNTEQKINEIDVVFKKLMSMTAEYEDLDFKAIDKEKKEGK